MSVTLHERQWIPGEATSYTKITCTYVGATIEIFCREERIMSDVWDGVYYARVWDDAEGKPRNIRLWTCGWENRNRATEDATPEVSAKYEAWKVAEAARKAAEEAASRAAQAAWEAKQPRKGRTLRVVKGRKVPKGTEGVCIWIGQGYYGGMRVGIKADDGEVYWTAASNVEAIAS